MSEEDDIPPDPGPVVRMVTHLKEAAMIAYRLGHNGMRATSTTVGTIEDAFAPSGIYGEDTIRLTIDRALKGMFSLRDHAVEEDKKTIDALAKFLIDQIERGIIAGSAGCQ